MAGDAKKISDSERGGPASSLSFGSPAGVVAVTPSIEAGICCHCQRWEPYADDRYCSWCGKPVMIVSIDQKELHFSADQTERILQLCNNGTNVVLAALDIESEAEPERFTISPERPDNLFEIPAGASQPLTITVDLSEIDAEADYSAQLVIDSNAPPPNDSILVPLRVERPPIARLLPAGEKQVIIFGDQPFVRVSVRNDGGGILHAISGSIQEPRGAAGEQPVNANLAAGEQAYLQIPLELQTLPAGEYIVRGEITFANHQLLGFKQELTFRRPPRIRLEPRQLLAKLSRIVRKDRLEVSVENIGDDVLRIGEIKSSELWAEPRCANKLVPPKQRTYVDLYIDGTSLECTSYSGQLRIVSNSFDGVAEVPFLVQVRDLMPLQDAIGVDFGTSLSCVATVKNGDPVLVNINPGSDSDSVEGQGLPSVVFFEENFFPIVGVVAKERARFVPTAAIQSVKRVLGSRRKLRVRDREFQPTEVATEIFRSLLSAVERTVVPPASPIHAVLTVPADISDEQIGGVLTAASAAGLDVDHTARQEFVLDEPSAAALYYLWKCRKQQDLAPEELVFIYDFGAGTLDCSLVHIKRVEGKITIRVLATTGDRQLGGDDIDRAIARHIARKLRESDGFDDWPIQANLAELAQRALTDEAGYRKAMELRLAFFEKCEQMKISLASEPAASMSFPLGSRKEKSYRLTIEEFNRLLQPFLKRSDLVVKGCCHLAGISPKKVHSVLHTGRISATPAIRERVNGLFPAASDKSGFIDAKRCVALGAAWWAYIKNRPGVDIQFEGLQPRLPHSIGYVGASGLEAVFRTIFDAGQSFPAERELTFRCQPGRRLKLEIQEQPFGLDGAVLRSRGSVLLPAAATVQDHHCIFRLTPNRTLEVIVGNEKLEIDPHEDEEIYVAEE